MRPEDDGFTLIELIFSMVIVGLILTAVTSALMVFYKNGAYTTRRDDHSSGSQLLSTYLNRDVMSATDAATSVPSACPSSTLPTGYTFLTGFKWTDFDATPASPSPAPSMRYAAVYAVGPDTTTVRPGGTGLQQIERWYCSTGASGSPAASVIDHQVLLQDLTGISTTAAVGSSASCPGPGSPYSLTLPAFETDASTPYVFNGCLGARQQ